MKEGSRKSGQQASSSGQRYIAARLRTNKGMRTHGALLTCIMVTHTSSPFLFRLLIAYQSKPLYTPFSRIDPNLPVPVRTRTKGWRDTLRFLCWLARSDVHCSPPFPGSINDQLLIYSMGSIPVLLALLFLISFTKFSYLPVLKRACNSCYCWPLAMFVR